MDFDYSYLGICVLRLFTMSLIVQLALDSLYRWDGFASVERLARAWPGVGIKFPLALGLSYLLCLQTSFDVLAEVFTCEDAFAGRLVTALAVTGGTQPFLALFAKIEAMREASKTIVVREQTARGDGKV